MKKTIKILLSLLLCFCFSLTLSTSLSAASITVNIEGTEYTSNASGPGWTLVFNNASKATLTLNNADIEYSGNSNTINVLDGDLDVVLIGNNTIKNSAPINSTLASNNNASGISQTNGSGGVFNALQCTGSIYISSSDYNNPGTLNLYSNWANLFCMNDLSINYANINMHNGCFGLTTFSLAHIANSNITSTNMNILDPSVTSLIRCDDTNGGTEAASVMNSTLTVIDPATTDSLFPVINSYANNGLRISGTTITAPSTIGIISNTSVYLSGSNITLSNGQTSGILARDGDINLNNTTLDIDTNTGTGIIAQNGNVNFLNKTVAKINSKLADTTLPTAYGVDASGTIDFELTNGGSLTNTISATTGPLALKASSITYGTNNTITVPANGISTTVSNTATVVNKDGSYAPNVTVAYTEPVTPTPTPTPTPSSNSNTGVGVPTGDETNANMWILLICLAGGYMLSKTKLVKH